MLQQIYATELQVGDVLATSRTTIESISTNSKRVLVALSGKQYAKFDPTDVIAIVARYVPIYQNQ